MVWPEQVTPLKRSLRPFPGPGKREGLTSYQRDQLAYPSEGPHASPLSRPGKHRCQGKERGGSSRRGWAGGLTEHLNVPFGDGVEAAAGKQDNVGFGGLGHGVGGSPALVQESPLFLCLDMSAEGEKKARLRRWMLWTPRSRSRRKPRHSPPLFNACSSGNIWGCLCMALLCPSRLFLVSFATLDLVSYPSLSLAPTPPHSITPPFLVLIYKAETRYSSPEL